MGLKHFSPQVKNELKSYVYLYSDRAGNVFYIGKGKGNRCFDHLLSMENEEGEKAQRIRELLKAGQEPVIEILRWGLDDSTAFAVEQAAIDLLGLHNLTNLQSGHQSATQGRISAEQLERRLSAKPVTQRQIDRLKELGVLLVRLSLYRPNMGMGELYDLTRAAWKLSKAKLDFINYAFAVVDGKIIETYRVAQWLQGHSTYNSVRGRYYEDSDEKGRFEFVGDIDWELHKKYADLDVSALFTKGQQNPVKYLLKE